MDVTEISRPARTVAQRAVISATVTTPAPQAFTDPVFVIDTEVSQDRPVGPCKWGALHGASLPTVGAAATVAFDHLGVPVVVWWDGPTVFAAAPPAPPSYAGLAKLGVL